IALDRQQLGTVVVATLDRFAPGDTVWRSTDDGATWKDIGPKTGRDARETPFLYWGEDTPKLGWWMAALAIDPFDSNHACYATCPPIYAPDDLARADSNETTRWRPWVPGIEQTAVIALLSPPAGAHLISAFGDIGGFTHDDLGVSPPIQSNPIFTNTNFVDCA